MITEMTRKPITIETTKIGDMTVARYIVRYGAKTYVTLVVPMHGWKHPVRIMVYENDGGNPGRSAKLEPGEWRSIRDAILMDMGHLTEEGMCGAY